MSRTHVTARLLLIAMGAATLSAAPAGAVSPEQLYEAGPPAGHFQVELNGQFALSKGGATPHSLEIYAGVTERLSLAAEIEGEREDGRFRAEEVGVGALLTLSGEDAPLEIAVLAKAGVALENGSPRAEGRLILEREAGAWGLLGNLILQSEREDGRTSTSLAYAALVQRQLTRQLHFGVESSGQAGQIGAGDPDFEKAHYFGPSIAFKPSLMGFSDLELGLKYLRRIRGDGGHSDVLRMTASLEL